MAKGKELELRLQRTEQQLNVFQRVSRLMVRDLSLSEVLQGIVSLVVEYTQCDSCLIYLLDGEDLVLCASNTPHPSTIGKLRLRSSEGLTGWVARERRLLAISREAYKDPRFKTFGELPEDSYEAFLSAPVIARNRVVGVINVQHRPAPSALRERNGSPDDGGRTGGLHAGAGTHVGGRAGIRQPRGISAFLRTRGDETIRVYGEHILSLASVRGRRALSLVALRFAAAGQNPRWRLQYFYDENKTELVLQDIQTPCREARLRHRNDSERAWRRPQGGGHSHQRRRGALGADEAG